MSYLVDTNIISELSRLKPNPGVLQWASQVHSHSLSAVSVEEIAYGIARFASVRLHAWMESSPTA